MKTRLPLGMIVGWLLGMGVAAADRFSVATYNVENYLDAPVPGRTTKPPEAKARVCDTLLALRADVVALQEMGGTNALLQLRAALAAGGLSYPHWEHVRGHDTNIHVALLSRFPITARRLYELGGVNRVVPTGKAIETALEWASVMADRPPAALQGIKRMLTEGDNILKIADSVMNDQTIFQSFSGAPAALATMAAAQARFDKGETPRTVYGGPY